MRILLAVDQSLGSESAVLEVAARYWEPGSTVRLLHVIDEFVPPAAELWYDAGGSLEHAKAVIVSREERLMEEIAFVLREVDLDVETVIRGGNPTKCILTEAEEWKADLIVVGSNERHAITRALFGSVSRSVCEQAQCCVEVVH
jgi:nucleotide-binding universal stress UspA family protein